MDKAVKQSVNPVPLDTVKAVIERRNAGMKNPSVETNADGYIIPRSGNKNKDRISDDRISDDRISDYTVMVRPSKRDGPRETSRTAAKLKACKGKKGCEFAKCVEDAFGKMPGNFQRLCPTGVENNIESKENYNG